MEQPLAGLAAILALGIGAQWVSWRFRLPAILILLIAGFLAGPVSGLIQPDELLGELLFPIVSLSVAVILFEGGLSLDIAELRVIGKVVRNLISLGVLITFALSTVAAHALLGLQLGLALLLGGILVVTGPTVIVPLLRHIKPSPRVSSAVKWEGIVNDPIGAIMAVLIFEAIVSGGFEQGITVALTGMLKALFFGAVLGLAGAALIVVVLRRYWVPEFLQSTVTLAVVVAVFTGSNLIQEESGLLTVTVMGSALASQKLVTVREIIAFKENLRVLLISLLFIVLAARLELEEVISIDAGTILFIAALIVVVRPAAVFASTWRSILSWPERVFLAFMAPRGIVAAAVSSLFAIELTERGYESAGQIATVTFLVIVVTVAFYGLSAGPVAKILKVASPSPQGMLMAGAGPWVRDFAKLVHENGIKVHLVDSNWANISAARSQGIKGTYGNVLSESLKDDIALGGIGRMLAVTPNDEVNSLAALQFRDIFGRENVFQLTPEGVDRGGRPAPISPHLRGRLLFSPDASHRKITRLYDRGARIKQTRLTEEFDYEDFRAHYGEDVIPLAVLRDDGELTLFDAEREPTPKSGQTLIALARTDNGNKGRQS